MDFELRGQIICKDQVFDNSCLKQMEEEVLSNFFNLRKGERVALALERTPLMMVTLIALLEKGIPFLPFDTSFPEERLNYMLDKAEIGTIISNQEMDLNIMGGRKVLRLSDMNGSSTPGIVASEEEIDSNETAYILFTSGTTGLPKAVNVLRKGLRNFIEGIVEKVEFPKECRIACITNITFDIFFLESVLALTRGMTVVLADESERNNPRLIKKLIEDNRVNVMQCTPSTMKMLEMIDPSLQFLQNMDVLMLGGEPFPSTMLNLLQKVVRGKIYNMYGPTETTIWSTLSDLTNAKEINIGKPIKNTAIYIADDGMNLLEAETEGEILIAGDGLAKGYINDEERTKKAFLTLRIDDKFVRVYRTGDYGYLGSDGDYRCVGRRDGQVKVMGHRIEMGDVEYHINRIAGVQNNIVAADPDNENRLICFYLSEDKTEESKLRKKALKVLPDYMVPSSWVQVEELLYTSSGKSDRKAMLQRYKKSEGEALDNTECREQEDKDVLQVLKECFSFTEQEIERDTVLKDLGVDSIKYVQVLVSLEEIFNVEFEDEMLSGDYFDTVNDLIEFVLNGQ